MAEKESIKVSLGTVVCIIIIILLVIALGGMYYYYNYVANKNETKNEVNISNKIENTVNNEINTNSKSVYIKTNLSNAEKINANKELNTKLLYILRVISDDNLDNLKTNTNLLSSKENRAQILWYAMYFDNAEFSPYDQNGDVASGQATIDVDVAKEYYKKVFKNTSDKEFQELLEVYNNFNYFTVKNDKIYGGFPTGWGIDSFELKINSIEFNESINSYKATVNILKPSNNDEDAIINMIEKYSSENILEWPDELNYAKLEIEYEKDSNDNYKLISLTYVK